MRISLNMCMFCGGTPQIVEVMRMNIKNNMERGYKVECLKCGVKTRDFHTKRGAADAWNERKTWA